MRAVLSAVTIMAAVALARPQGPSSAPSTRAPPANTPAPPPTFPSGWIDLFAPPYDMLPNIVPTISAIDNVTQIVGAGGNNDPFAAYFFNGQVNGQLTQLKQASDPLMILASAAGGTAANPKAVIGGFGFGNGLQYLVNATAIAPSYIPTVLVQAQGIRMSRDGKRALAIDGIGANFALFSNDSGATFNEKLIRLNYTLNCTLARYGAMIDANTWYVTFGSWTKRNSSSSESRFLTELLEVYRDDHGKVKHRIHSPQRFSKVAFDHDVGSMGSSSSASSSSSGACIGYSAAIAKTTDGGNTWAFQVNYDYNDFYFNEIDCFSATHCVAVGEGFNDNPGGHVWLTTDGSTWKEVLFQPSSNGAHYSFTAVKVTGTSEKEAWIAGTIEGPNEAIFFHTADGGRTWQLYPHGLPNLGAILSLSFLENGIGFATAVTAFQDSTILRYDPSGPPPPGYFIQSQCVTAQCDFLCQNISFPQSQCIQAGDGSVIAVCTPTEIVQKAYSTSDCTGSFTNSTMALGKCLQGGNGYFENFCPSSSGFDASLRTARRGGKLRRH